MYKYQPWRRASAAPWTYITIHKRLFTVHIYYLLYYYYSTYIIYYITVHVYYCISCTGIYYWNLLIMILTNY